MNQHTPNRSDIPRLASPLMPGLELQTPELKNLGPVDRIVLDTAYTIWSTGVFTEITLPTGFKNYLEAQLDKGQYLPGTALEIILALKYLLELSPFEAEKFSYALMAQFAESKFE